MRLTDLWFRRVRFRMALLSTVIVALASGIVFALIYTAEVHRAEQHICELFALSGPDFVHYHVSQVGRLLFFAWGALTSLAALAGYCFAPFVTRAADEAMENLSRSADAVAHDLKAPLTRLKVRCEMAVSGGDSEAAFAAEVSSDIDSLLTFINTLLEIARLERAGATRDEKVDLCHLVQDVEDLYRPLAENAGLDLRIRRPLAPLWLKAHRGKMMQVLGNLVDNAFKYTPRGGFVSVSVRKEEGDLLLEVSDTGVGIPAEEMPHLFEKFYRGKQADAPGNGVGLSLVKAIVAAYEGEIRVTSQPGKGSTFVVRLPQI